MHGVTVCEYGAELYYVELIYPTLSPIGTLFLLGNFKSGLKSSSDLYYEFKIQRLVQWLVGISQCQEVKSFCLSRRSSTNLVSGVRPQTERARSKLISCVWRAVSAD